MRAMLLDTFGDVSGFRLADIPRPEPKPGEVLVRIKAASVNPVDGKIRQFSPFFAPELPAVLGCDMAGVVEAVGAEVVGFRPGEPVYGCVGGMRGLPGTYAEYVAADAALLAHKPESLSFAQAAALPLVTLTAWEALHDRGRIAPCDHVLIHGGTGGVGHVAVQIAKAHGCCVATTASTEAKAALATQLGADQVINYKTVPVADYVRELTGGRGFDVVFDTVGGKTLDDSFTAARLKGRVLSTNARGAHDLTPMHEKGLSLSVVFMLIPLFYNQPEGRARQGEILREAAGLVADGRLTPLLDPEPFDLEDVAKAQAYLEGGHATGKVVLHVAD